MQPAPSEGPICWGWGAPYVPVPGPCSSPMPTLPASLECEKREDSLLTAKAARQHPPCAMGPVARPVWGGTSLPKGRLQSLSLLRGAGDDATQAFQLCVIAKFHKGIFMLSEYCLLYESNYRSCHGGVTRR